MSSLVASSTSDLSSPSQETRDAAAKIIRDTYTPPSRTNWDSLVASIKVGDNKTNVFDLLQRLNIKCEIGIGGGIVEGKSCRLDDLWMLEWSYRSTDGIIEGCRIHEEMRDLWIVPPSNFTGIWTTYFVNGQKSHEIHYKDGSYSGEFVAFYPNGSKCCVQHYNHHIAEGDDTGFFPSGRIMYQGQYRTNVHVGAWIRYNEDGSTNSIKNYSKP